MSVSICTDLTAKSHVCGQVEILHYNVECVVFKHVFLNENKQKLKLSFSQSLPKCYPGTLYSYGHDFVLHTGESVCYENLG